MTNNITCNNFCNVNANKTFNILLDYLNKTEKKLNIHTWFLLKDKTFFREKLKECLINLIKKKVEINLYVSDLNYFGLITDISSKLIEKTSIDFEFYKELKLLGVNIIYIKNTHIKCMISDNKRVYIGGRNLMGSYWQCDYIKNHTNFMDIDIIVEDENLAKKINEILDPEKNLFGLNKLNEIEIFYENPIKLELWKNFLYENIKKAKKQIIIHNSNIENNEIIENLLEIKKKNNIPIKIYTNKTPSSDYVSKHFDLYTLENSYFYHAKLYIIDDDIYIGSYNIDPVSEVINKEILIKIPNKYNLIKNILDEEYLPNFKLYKSNDDILSKIKEFIYKMFSLLY